jgi:lipoprotein-releasing system ATP-binding protein
MATTIAGQERSALQDIPVSCSQLHRYLGRDESRVHVLRGVSMEAQPGSVHAIVGPSGCGKSTLLYVLGLLDTPDSGTVAIGGEEVSGLTDIQMTQKRLEFIGFVFQFHFLMHEFTAQENVMIPMRRLGKLGLREMRERAAWLLETVGLGDKMHRPSNHLSGGEQQRVAIARALANDPKIILADEPTGNLDTANSERVFSLLTELVKREQKALLLATHNPAIAQASDWIHEMKDGVITRSYPGASHHIGEAALGAHEEGVATDH